MSWSLWLLSRTEHLAEARLFAIALASFCAVVIWQGIKSYQHRRNLKSVPIRIHVAGTRGKSTTTRLIAAGLRAGGIRVLAKATGSQPRLILPDGTERLIRRRGRPSVREQEALFHEARKLQVEAVVAECMAIRPEFVWASEKYLVQATTAVITNARSDHSEELGEASGATIETLAWAVPAGGHLVIAAEADDGHVRARAAARKSRVSVVDTAGLDGTAANRALALAVCQAHGVPAAIAEAGMDAAAADPGNFSEHALNINGKSVRFANAFACNDVESLASLWRTMDSGAAVVLLNARPDRPLRTRQFLGFVAGCAPKPLLFVVGDSLPLRLAKNAGFAPGAVRRLQARTAKAALTELASAAPNGGCIWGIGNYRGFGSQLANELRSSDC